LALTTQQQIPRYPDTCAFISTISGMYLVACAEPKMQPKKGRTKIAGPDSWRRRLQRPPDNSRPVFPLLYIAYTRWDTYIHIYIYFFALSFAHFAHSSLHCLKLHYILYLETRFHFLVGNLRHKANILRWGASKFAENTVDFIFYTLVFQLNDLGGPRPGKQIHSSIAFN